MCHDYWTTHNEGVDRGLDKDGGHPSAWVSSACSQCGSYYGAVTASFLWLRFRRLIKSLASAGLPSEHKQSDVARQSTASCGNLSGTSLARDGGIPYFIHLSTPPPVSSVCVSGHSLLQQVFKKVFWPECFSSVCFHFVWCSHTVDFLISLWCPTTTMPIPLSSLITMHSPLVTQVSFYLHS